MANFDRRTHWEPTPRPDWVARLNTTFAKLDQGSIVPLDPDSLIAQAIRDTGLSDFGEGNWREHFTVLMHAIDTEARLHFAGRLLTRSEMVLHLTARLQVVEAYKRFPQIEDEQVAAPVFITGFGRSGTTILFEVLAQDPRFRVAERWETLFPYPPPEPETYASDARIARTEAQDGLFAGLAPELQAAHESGARLPVESLEMEYASFISDVFPIQFQIPSYAAHLAKHGNADAIAWQRKVLKLLQFRMKGRRWLMKSPSHLPHLPTILNIFPDMRVIFTHRDPVATADSITSIMGTLYWLRTDHPWGDGNITSASLSLAEARARQWDAPIGMIRSGRLQESRLANFHYAEFIADPIEEIRNLYAQLAMELTPQAEERMRTYLAGKPQGKLGRHTYTATPSAELDAERAAYREYEAFFGVARER